MKDIAHVSLTAVRQCRCVWPMERRRHEHHRLLWKPRSGNRTSLWSQVADGVDYYFAYGPELDDVVAGLPGNSPGRQP